MCKRFVSVWFPYLMTDWFSLRDPSLRMAPTVISALSHGRMMITAGNALAAQQGIIPGMVVADARAIFPSLQVVDGIPGITERLLKRLAEWCIRFTPCVAVDLPDGLVFDASGCAHLWGGEEKYLAEIEKRLQGRGYTVRTAMADTIGAAWGMARFGKGSRIIEKGQQANALLSLPPAALRLEVDTEERLRKLGLRQIRDFVNMPGAALRRRFGSSLVTRLNQALGYTEEIPEPVIPVLPYQERLPCIEPIVTGTGIAIALQRLLETLCTRLQQEGKGLRTAVFKSYRADGKIEQVEIGTHRASCHVNHLFKLFELKLPSIAPGPGIELFTLEAPKVEDHSPRQEKIWENSSGLENPALGELLDRLAGKIGSNRIHRYLPDEHYWPERSYKKTASLEEKPATVWKVDRPRPLYLLSPPEPIEVTAPIPDYPPMFFKYKSKLHKIVRADGPERIEQEWWLQEGQHRDYYYVEDEEGIRYWLFRSGHYDADKTYRWFLHGLFA